MLSFLSAVSATMQLAAATPAQSELRGEALMAALRTGGYTILVRHARTDRSIPTRETPAWSPPLRADQRNLTAQGEQDVRLMAEVVRRYAWPISEVISSPIYRCRETADAFGTPAITWTLRNFPTTDTTAALVAAAPRPGTNRVLVTHHFVIENHVPGIRPGDIGESEAAVVRPTGDGRVTLVGKILLADWTALAGTAGAAATPAAAAQGHNAHAAHAYPAGSVALPDTRVGRLSARYIEFFNTGDTAHMRVFTESFLVAVPDRTTEARVQTYVRMFADYGPITVTGIQESSADSLVAGIRTSRGDMILRVVMAPEPSARAQSITFAMRAGGGHP